MQSLFEPFYFPNTDKIAKNRIALAPMTNKQSEDDGTLGEDEYLWLTRRAQEGFGIIFTCAAHIQKDGQGWEGEMGNFDNHHIPGLTKLADGIRKYGSLSIMQLFHGGARSPEHLILKQPWSASSHDFELKDKKIPVRGATLQDIETVKQSFVKAAIRAYHAGFDGVELHAAHGYLLHQFLSTTTNKRTDDYGGSLANRARIITEILESIRLHLPPYFLVGVRISPEDKFTYKGIDFDDSLTLGELLIQSGADFLDISTWASSNTPLKYPNTVPIISWFRQRLGNHVPLFVAGEIWSGQDATQALNAGADFVSIGKAAIGHANWPSIIQNKDTIPPFPPYSIEHLRQQSLGPAFIQYMNKWKNFVQE